MAVVSGGGSGIGRAIARMFALDGSDVLIVGRRAAPLQEASREINAEAGGSPVRWLVADLADPDQAGKVADAVPGAVDVIVNNAGGVASRGTDDATLAGVAAAWRRDFEGNVLSAVLLTTALAPRLRRPGRHHGQRGRAGLRRGDRVLRRHDDARAACAAGGADNERPGRAAGRCRRRGGLPGLARGRSRDGAVPPGQRRRPAGPLN
jgi:NAD(P)-dependent dehydrogenase (short-subunit alcohol dehydrogenase family)